MPCAARATPPEGQSEPAWITVYPLAFERGIKGCSGLAGGSES